MNIQNIIPWTRTTERTPAVSRSEDGDPFLALYRDVNRLFDDAFRSFGAPASGPQGWTASWPSIEVKDGDAELRVTAEVPGLRPDEVEILLADNALTLRGEKREETEDKERRFTERFYGRFERRIPLPYEVEADKVSADFENGVLTVVLPKSPREQSHVRRIEIGKRP